MNWRTLAELIGLIAVVASLLMVAYELRQTQTSIRASAHSLRAERSIELSRFVVETKTRAIRERWLQGEQISTDEQQILDAQLTITMRHFEDLHYQHQQGLLTDETWAANLRGIDWSVRRPGFKRLWSGNEPFYRKSFVDLVEKLVKEDGQK